MSDLDVACRLSTVECGGKALGEIGLVEASRSGDLKQDGLGLGVGLFLCFRSGKK